MGIPRSHSKMYPVAPASLILFVKCIGGNPFLSFSIRTPGTPRACASGKLSGAKMLSLRWVLSTARSAHHVPL